MVLLEFFLHSAKIFTRTAFTAFMTNIRYAHLVPWDGQRRTWDTNHQNGIETSRSSFRMKGNIWSCPIVKYQKMLLLLVMVLVILWEVEETDMAGGRSFTGWRIHLRTPHVPPYSKHKHESLEDVEAGYSESATHPPTDWLIYKSLHRQSLDDP